MTLPVIPFYPHPAPAQAIHKSLSQSGFMQISDIGIEPTLLAEVYAVSRVFFTGDQQTKSRCGYRSAQENFGYQGLLEENLDPTAPADIKETFTMRNILTACPEDQRWPSVAFKELMQAFYAQVLQASYALQRVMAKQLGEAEDFFVRVHNGENISLRLLYYPAQDANSVSEGQLGAGAHTDYGFLTLLFQDNVGGLQVLGSDNTWMDVPPEDGAVVVNSGDLLERWTNGTYRSTLHRVMPRTNGQDRLSIAMFIDPDTPTMVTPLNSCVTEDQPCRFDAITAGEHIQTKLAASHKARFQK